MMNDPKLTFAIEVVKEASLLVKKIQTELTLTAITKDDKSPVTIADFASQALVACRMMKAFPDAILIGEEDSTSLRTPESRLTLESITQYVSEFIPGCTPEEVCEWIDFGCADSSDHFWTLDPIDGTKGFLRGDQYVVALAYVENGNVEIGVLGCPNLTDAIRPDFSGPGSIVYAKRSEGTWTIPMLGSTDAPRQLRVSDESNIANARSLRSFESGHTNVGLIEQFTQTLQITAEPVRMDSQAKYAIMAAGGGELLLRLISPNQPEYKEKIWDQAAGSLIVEEAGGRITDLNGSRLDFSHGRKLVNNRGVLVSNGILHQEALTILKQINA